MTLQAHERRQKLSLWWCARCGAVRAQYAIAPHILECCDAGMLYIVTSADEKNRFGEAVGDPLLFEVDEGKK